MLNSITHLQTNANVNIGEGVDWFAIAPDEIRTREILREKADRKQPKKSVKLIQSIYSRVLAWKTDKRSLVLLSISYCDQLIKSTPMYYLSLLHRFHDYFY